MSQIQTVPGPSQAAFNALEKFADKTSTISKNTTYIGSDYTTLYQSGNFAILSICFNLTSNVSLNTDLYTGLPFNNVQCYCSIAKNDGTACRARVYRGVLQFEDSQTAGWFDGQVVIPLQFV